MPRPIVCVLLCMALLHCAAGQNVALQTSPSGEANQVIGPRAALPTPSPNTLAGPCDAHVQICDDFESDAPGAQPNSQVWSTRLQNSQESISIDATHAYSGKQSLHIHVPNNGYQDAELINTSLFPVLNNSFYGRAYVYIGQLPQIHTNLIHAGGILPGQSATTYAYYGSQGFPFLAGYYDNDNSSNVIDDWQHAGTDINGVWVNATPVPTARWACLEWQFKGDTNEMHLWVDGQAIPSMDVLGKSNQSNSNIPWTAPSYTEIGVGLTVIQNSEAFDHFDMWLDAVALDAQRIGCAAP